EDGIRDDLVTGVQTCALPILIANVSAGTYTVDITMPSFKTLSRKGLAISGGDRAALGVLILEIGGTQEVVNVTADAPLLQAQSEIGRASCRERVGMAEGGGAG